jgi:hypothetical protein
MQQPLSLQGQIKMSHIQVPGSRIKEPGPACFFSTKVSVEGDDPFFSSRIFLLGVT